MLDQNETLAPFGADWAIVCRYLFVNTRRQGEAWQIWRLLHHDKQVQVEEMQGRAGEPLCKHGRRTVTLYQGRPLCACEGVEAAAAIGRMCKGVRS